MNLNIKEIKGTASSNLTFERGVDYYDQGRVKNFEQTEQADSFLINAEVQGSRDDLYHVHIAITGNHDIEGHCDCDASQNYPGSCKHIIASLLHFYYHREHKENATEEKSDKNVLKLITAYTNQGVKNLVLQTMQKKVTIIPSLYLNYNNEISLSFSIGHDRFYVIRNIYRFYYAMRDEEVSDYGKGLTVFHHIDSFTDESKALVRFVLNVCDNHLFYASNNRNGYYENRNLILSPQAFDQFFRLWENKPLMLNNRGTETEITFIDSQPTLLLTINVKGDETYTVSLNVKKSVIVEGHDQSYLLIDRRLYRLDADNRGRLSILLKIMNESDGSLKLVKKDMRAFCSNVLDEIRNAIKIEAPDGLLDEFGTVPMVAQLYLDAPDKELVTGKLKFIYNDEEFDVVDKNTDLNTYRNIKLELYTQNLVSRFFDDFDQTNKQYYTRESGTIYNLYFEGLNAISNNAQIFATNQFKRLFRDAPAVKFSIRLNSNLLDIDIDAGDFPMDELASVLSAYTHEKKYFRLSDGSFVSCENNAIGELSQIADVLDLSEAHLKEGTVAVPKYRALYLDTMLQNSDMINFERTQDFKKIIRDIKEIDNSYFDIPVPLQNVLRNYQKTGFSWLKTLSFYGFGGILADDMGLGKTLEIISLLLSYVSETKERKPSLVITPASLVLNWKMEFTHFAPDIQPLLIIGNAEERKALIAKIPDYDVIITSYDYIKRDIDLYENCTFSYEIIDEAQYIKNHTTLNAKSVKKIHADIRFALSGTPIENSLAELWSIFDYIMPGYLYSYKKFYDKFEAPIVKDEQKKALNALKKSVAPFILRRLKKDVLKELPDKTETVMYTALDGEQKKLYLANLLSIKHELADTFEKGGFAKSKIKVLSMLMRLRQLCCDPSLYYQDYKGDSAKLEMAMEIIESSVEAGHKLLLFSQFTSMLAIIADKLYEAGISFYLLEGKTPKEERLKLVDSFNSDKTPVFLISLKAGGTGINLTSADVVIHYDPWWNISAETQATDRTHRIGQKEHVQVYKLIAKDTIEEKILLMQESKLKLADSVITGEEGIISGMTQEEIMNLFKE